MKSRKDHSQCFGLDAAPYEVQKCIKEGHPVGVILRGVTGSGKSTLAEQLFDATNDKHIIISSDGSDCSQITKMVRKAVSDNMALIVVDAENIERSVIKTLAGVLIPSSYECFVMEPTTSWKYDADRCKKHSERGEAVEEIERKIDVILKSSIMWSHIFNGKVVISNFHEDDGSMSVSTPTSIQSSSSSTSPNQFFSLAPTPKLTTSKTIATNVSMECIIFELAGNESRKHYSGYRLIEEETFTASDKNTDRTPPSQSTQTEEVLIYKEDQVVYRPQEKLACGTTEDKEFALLRLIMPEVDLGVLSHYHQVLGFKEAFVVFQGLGFVQSTKFLPEDSQEIREEINNEESHTVSNRLVDDEVEIRRSERANLHFNEDIFIPEETANDEVIARTMQNDERNFQQSQEDKNLARLKLCFPTADEAEIAHILEAMRTFEGARLFLKQGGHPEAVNGKNSYSTRTAVNCQPRPKPEKSETERNNHFLNATSTRARQSLLEVQRFALNRRAGLENDRIAETSHISSVRAEFQSSIMAERVARRRETMTTQVQEIDEKIRNAHQNPYFLDLHYMSVEGALKLVDEALEAVRYYIKYLNKASRRLTVVTGYGNNSKEGAKIKPNITKKLNNEKISFHMINDGCIQIKL